MEIETINGIKNVDLSKITLNDVCGIITEISVDVDVNNKVPTILYSGSLCEYSTNSIAKSLDNVRIIDNTDLGKFLSSPDFGDLLRSALQVVHLIFLL